VENWQLCEPPARRAACRQPRRALKFFTDILGFETPLRIADHPYVQRETVGFGILQQTGDDGAPPGNRRFAYYIDVRDVDQLYAELKPKLDRLPKGVVYGPLTRATGNVSCP